MNPEKLAELYNQLSINIRAPEKCVKQISELWQFLSVPDQLSELDRQELVRFEQEKIGAKEHSITSICFEILDRLVTNAGRKNFNQELYNQVRDVLKAIIKIVSYEILNQAHMRYLAQLKIEQNIFSLALHHMLCLQRHRLNAELPGVPLRELQSAWFEQICKPIMQHADTNVDLKLPLFDTNLMECLKCAIPGEKICGQVNDLTSYVLEKTKQINCANNLGQTPLYIAIIGKFGTDYIQLLINRGADVNALCTGGNLKTYAGHVRIPLLSHCVKNKNYAVLRLLLNNSANPNLMPIRDQSYTASARENEYELTPYQLAVALQDDEAIACFVDHTQSSGIKLITDVATEKTSVCNNLRRHQLKVTGSSLIAACKANLFKSQCNLLENVRDKYGIRVYVSKDDERQQVMESIDWLATTALNSPVAYFWKPIWECLVSKMKSGPKFAIYVSDIPKSLLRDKPCLGLYSGNIHVAAGIGFKQYCITIAHEAAHMFDDSKINLQSSEYQRGALATDFVAALHTDIEQLRKSNPSSQTLSLYQNVAKEHANSGLYKEFFAHMLIDRWFEELLVNQQTDTTFKSVLVDVELPNTHAWFKRNFYPTSETQHDSTAAAVDSMQVCS